MLYYGYNFIVLWLLALFIKNKTGFTVILIHTINHIFLQNPKIQILP